MRAPVSHVGSIVVAHVRIELADATRDNGCAVCYDGWDAVHDGWDAVGCDGCRNGVHRRAVADGWSAQCAHFVQRSAQGRTTRHLRVALYTPTRKKSQGASRCGGRINKHEYCWCSTKTTGLVATFRRTSP